MVAITTTVSIFILICFRNGIISYRYLLNIVIRNIIKKFVSILMSSQRTVYILPQLFKISKSYCDSYIGIVYKIMLMYTSDTV